MAFNFKFKELKQLSLNGHLLVEMKTCLHINKMGPSFHLGFIIFIARVF
jgi:hypothetical protein